MQCDLHVGESSLHNPPSRDITGYTLMRLIEQHYIGLHLLLTHGLEGENPAQKIITNMAK